MSLEKVVSELPQFTHDPLGYIYFAFPWGQGELAKYDGPDQWHVDFFNGIRAKLEAGGSRGAIIREAVSSGHGSGKAECLTKEFKKVIVNEKGEAIAMKDILWGDLKTGDYVFGKDGTPTRVLQTHYQGVRPVYRVTFDDGSFTECDEDHLWNVKGRKERRNKIDKWRTLSTKEILALGVKRSNGHVQTKQWEIPIQEPVQFKYQEVFHPYAVGVWLGDGCSISGAIGSTREEIFERIGATPNKDTTEYRKRKYLIHTPKGMVKALKKYGVFPTTSCQKYVPDVYKYNNEKVRREILAGLLDTDGEAHKAGSIGYSSTSKRLVEDVIWLARSLGAKAKLQKSVKVGAYTKEGLKHICKPCYRATINFGGKWNPFTHTYKKELLKEDIEHRYLCRWIESIEYVGDRETMCITVEAEDHLYLTNDFIVTHNSCGIAWLLLWAMSTCEQTKGVVTANTENQLKTKTWAELAKWYRMCINKDMFHMTATALFSTDPNLERNWRIDMVPWSERNTEAFAGLHNAGKRLILVMDEASAIPDTIWEVSEGALTDVDTEILWVVFGNPTKGTGRFKDCFHLYRHRWNTKKIDTRKVAITNKKQIQEWIDDYGEDSDFVRVRVRGEFPRAGQMQLIGSELVEAAVKREVEVPFGAPKLFGVDVARFGDDQTVIARLHGRKLEEIHRFQGKDTMEVAAIVVSMMKEYKPDVVFVDESGLGAGVVDRILQLGYSIIPVNSARKADDERMYFNKRAEMWGRMKKWLEGASIPNDKTLIDDLTGPEYGYDAKNRLQLEKKKDMKRRGHASPDAADAVAQCFAYETPPIYQYDQDDLLPEWTEDF